MTETTAMERHRLYEDAMALVLGTLFVSLGAMIYAEAVLLVGSTAGFALLTSYVTGQSFGLVFFLLNLPFYVLGVMRMGWAFTIRTFVAVGMVSLLSKLVTGWVTFATLEPLYATVIGSSLIGAGMLMLFRHRTGLGGINILALFLQERFGWRAGYIQLGIDLTLMLAAFFALPAENLALSVLGIAITNMIIAINHKPGRYMALS